MSSQVEIVNLGLSHLGVGKLIANLETEKSEEARTGNLFYETVINKVLEDFPWPFATKITALALIEEEPNTEWFYSYRYPVDCLNIRRVLSGQRTDSQETAEPYRIASDTAGKLIWTDAEDAQAEYTRKITDPQFFSPSFVMAASYLMAHVMAPRLTKGDQFKLGDKALQLYSLAIGQARGNALNEQRQDTDDNESGFTRVR